MHFKRVAVTCAIASTMLCAAIAGAQSHESTSSVRAAIDAVNKSHTDSYNSGKVADFASVYATDAEFFPPNAPRITGRKAITEQWQGNWKAGLRNVRLTTTEFDTHGDMAHEIGTYAVDIQPTAGGAVAHDHGKYIVLWKRDAKGQWQWYRDIYNSDLPATK